MTPEENAIVQTAVEYLQDEDTVDGDCFSGAPDLSWDIHPEEFLNFAEEDIAGNEKRHLVNALSNAKRAMECQADSLLYVYGLYRYAKKEKWSLPRKLECLQKMGVIAPRVLNKINRERNLLEHEYALPEAAKIADFVDIVALFIASTRPLMGRNYYKYVRFYNESIADPANVYYEVLVDDGIVHLSVSHPDQDDDVVEVPCHDESYPVIINTVLTASGFIGKRV